MALWSWWVGDPLPTLTPSADLSAEIERDIDLLTRITELDRQEIEDRLDAGHRVHVAWLAREPVAYGWVASLSAAIGELDVAFNLPPGDRYLWDFVTLPAWRGRGIYPRLLQAILAREARTGQRFWIIAAPENAASEAGIAKAGFQSIGNLSFLADLGVGSTPRGAVDRARIGAALLGVPLLEAVRDGRVLSPCWRCVMAASQGPSGAPQCWPTADSAAACTCGGARPR